VSIVGSLVSPAGGVALVLVATIALGGATIMLGAGRALARTWLCCFEAISKRVELDWTLGVRSRHGPTSPVRLGIARTPALELSR
jgi:hypothetical protein